MAARRRSGPHRRRCDQSDHHDRCPQPPFDRLGVAYGVKTQNHALLIINGARGVGSILPQIARRLTGLTVIATASRLESIA
jgi:NADPH:quinone reductase-like Zn-dependent oxidoreductase